MVKLVARLATDVDHPSTNLGVLMSDGFHLSFRLITVGGYSARLAYLVHKSGQKRTGLNIICPSTNVLNLYDNKRAPHRTESVVLFKF